MVKKVVVLAVLAAVIAGGAFAQSGLKLSAGVGGYFTSDFGGGIEASVSGQTVAYKTPYFGGGGFVFFDATYAEVNLGFFGGSGTSKQEGGPDTPDSDFSIMGLDIGLLGKYPLAMSDKLTLFPLLGIAYRVMLSVKDENGNQYKNRGGQEAPGEFSALWFRLGGGLDYSLTDTLFLRGEALYGLRLSNKVEDDMKNSASNTPGVSADTRLGHGLEVKIAVGYKF